MCDNKKKPAYLLEMQRLLNTVYYNVRKLWGSRDWLVKNKLILFITTK